MHRHDDDKSAAIESDVIRTLVTFRWARSRAFIRNAIYSAQIELKWVGCSLCNMVTALPVGFNTPEECAENPNTVVVRFVDLRLTTLKGGL